MRKRSAPQSPSGLPVLSGLRLPERGQKILVAVSGGLDSMVLLHTIKALAGARRWKLAVAHFNHRLRGRESDADEAFVRKVAATMKLPVFAGRADGQQIVTMKKASVEMGARRLRHEFLARTARLHGIKTVALAHHADDQVELFFLRLLRGAGGGGLGGMQWRSPSPVDDRISLVRPLLDLPRVALEKFAHEHRIRYREDSSNRSLDYLRNRIRYELLPLLRRNYQAGLNKTVLRSMEIAGAESNLVADLARGWLECRGFWHEKKKRGAQPPIEKANFDELPEAIQRQVLKLQIIELGFSPDFELIESIRLSPLRSVSVGVDDCVSRDATGRVSLCRMSVPAFDGRNVTLSLKGPGQIVFDNVELNWQVGMAQKHFGWAKTPAVGREFFDADKIGKEIVLRHWRAGDRFQPIGLRVAVKLQDLFTNAKVPRNRRYQLIVAETRSGIFWVEGLRISENFKLMSDTERVLDWRWRRPSE